MSDNRKLEGGVRHGVGGVIMRRGRILLLESRDPTGTIWTLPGGQVNDGETPDRALDREILEEVCLTVNQKIGLPPFSIEIAGVDWISFPFFVFDFTGLPQVGEPDIATSLGWFNVRGLPRLNEISRLTIDNRWVECERLAGVYGTLYD